MGRSRGRGGRRAGRDRTVAAAAGGRGLVGAVVSPVPSAGAAAGTAGRGAARPSEAGQGLERAGSRGDTGPEADRLKGILALRRLVREAGDEASARQRLAADPENARLRYDLGCALAGAGRYEETLTMLLSAAGHDPKLA